MRSGARLSIFLVAIILALGGIGPQASSTYAARHRLYVGTVTAISATALTIHSKTHRADFHFVINSQTAFLRRGQPIPRGNFKVGSYVTVSYSPGPHNSMIAYRISLRR